ncbi:MAG: ABC transporter substrate-binding protein [Actinomycetota bacterium]
MLSDYKNGRRSSRRRFAVTAGILGLLLALVAGCSGGDDGGEQTAGSSTPVAEENPDGGPTEEVETGTEDTAVVSPAGFDIDAVLAADPNCASPVTGEPLRIGYAADLGEIGGAADRPGSQAAEHMARLVNCAGGLAGRPVEVVVADVSGSPIDTRAATLGLLDQDVHVLLGPPLPDPGFRVLLAAGGDVAVIFTGATEPALADASALSFLVAFTDTQQSTVAAQFALTNGWRKAATFSSPGPYFGYNPLVFREAFAANGGEVVGDFNMIPLEDEDFADEVAAMAGNPPDVIFGPFFANQIIALRAELDAAGIQAEIIATDAFEAGAGYTFAGTDGVFHVTHSFAAEGSRVEALVTSMTAANGVPPEAASFAALAGDAFVVVADAYLRVQTTDPLTLGQAIADAQAVAGITGDLSYDGEGYPQKPIYVHEVVDGQPSLAATIGG